MEQFRLRHDLTPVVLESLGCEPCWRAQASLNQCLNSWDGVDQMEFSDPSDHGDSYVWAGMNSNGHISQYRPGGPCYREFDFALIRAASTSHE